jgi:tetratricopeptide (TPR) repeat protein
MTISRALVCGAVALGASVTVHAESKQAKAADAGKVAITTSSEEARGLYLKARDLQEKLRATDAHALFAQAVAKDPSFAMAYLGLATSGGGNQEFFDGLAKAVANADKASAGEQLLIRAADAGAKADPVHQKEALDKLVKSFPNDERVHNQLGAYYFGRADYAKAIASYERAIAINAKFSTPYNQLGYAYRFAGKLPEAERTFKKYIELIPDDPNPYDSFAELLMEEGKFDQSIQTYEKALKVDPNFIASYVGIGNDQIFQGKGDEARKTFARLTKAARNDGERRQALLWTAMSYVHEGAWDKGLAELDKMLAIAAAAKDHGNVAGDYNLIGTVLLEAGRPDEALAKFKAQIEATDKADVPPAVKEAARRGFLFNETWVAIVKHDVAGAKAKAAAYGKAISKDRLFEVRQLHELNGLIALEEKRFAAAAAEFAQAPPRDPRMFYLTALALQGAGDAKAAKASARKAAEFNGLAINYAFVRTKAKALLAGK